VLLITSQKADIVILLLLTISTSIYDPIYRRVIEEKNDEEKRLWCIVTYSSSLETFNSIVHIFHSGTPFLINLIAAIFLITHKSRRQSNLHSDRGYKQIFREQVLEHRRLLIAPVVLVILALPRLINPFTSKCMKSAKDSWIFLIGYFIAVVPSMLTLVVFILPSKFYMKEFHRTIIRYRSIRYGDVFNLLHISKQDQFCTS
jgi:hypothetical protein